MTKPGPLPEPPVERPALRGDLELTDAVERGIPYTYVRDPRTRRYIRIGVTAHLAAQIMDGTRDVSQIVRDVSVARGEDVPRAAIEKLMANFERLGFFAHQSPRGKEARTRGGLFYFIVPLLDPNSALDRLSLLWRGLASPKAAVLIALVIVAGAITHGWQLAHGTVPQLGTLTLVDTLSFYALGVLVVGGHELAHAFTLKRFGGEVHEMGIVLIYFQPCLFCNVTDAYRMSKSRRLWVSFAGIYFQLAVWGAATLVAAWLGAEQPLGRIAIQLTTVSGIFAVFVNLNPFLKLDGYYLLADWLEIPNLRPRSFAFVRSRIRQLLRGPSPTDPRARDPRESKILMAYGVLSTAFLTVLITGIVVWGVSVLRAPMMNLSTLLAGVLIAFLVLRLARAIWKTIRG